jgi:RHS repeat-associated protein
MSRITSITDPLNRTTSYGYDAAGSLTSVTPPLVGKAEYSRNDSGIVSQIKDLNGSLWNFTHSNQGRLLSLTDPLNNQRQYAYNSRGMLNKVTYPDSATQDIVYDPAGNLTQRTFSGGPTLQFAYNSVNNLISANNLTLTRDSKGQVEKTDDGGVYFSAMYSNDRMFLAEYNNNAFSAFYGYDENTGLLKTVSCSLPTYVSCTFTYNADRQLIGIQRTNGVNSTFSYDNAGRLIRIQEGVIIDAKYTLDAAGQVTQTDMTAPLDPSALITGGLENFAYDAASQVGTAGYAFDAQGRQITSPGSSFVWDGASRLTNIGNVNLTYNGMGDLLTRSDETSNIRYYYNYGIGLAPIVAEKDESTGQFLRYYVWTPGGQLLFMIDAANGNKVYHYHFDRTGSTLAMTDSTRAVTDSYAYDPYGRLLAHNGTNPQPFTFVGKYGVRQESTAMYQMRARYYDASTARFVSREPLWPRIGDPKQLNPYQYASNDPLTRVDVTGLEDMKARNYLTKQDLSYALFSCETDLPALSEYMRASNITGVSEKEFSLLLKLYGNYLSMPKCATKKPGGSKREVPGRKPPMGDLFPEENLFFLIHGTNKKDMAEAGALGFWNRFIPRAEALMNRDDPEAIAAQQALIKELLAALQLPDDVFEKMGAEKLSESQGSTAFSLKIVILQTFDPRD